MTTKQAADIIRMLLGYLKGEIEPPKQKTIEEARAFEQQGYECLEMAIEALEQQPCEMTVEEYRQRMIDAFHNANCDNLIALVALPSEKEFEHLEWLLKNHYHNQKQKPCEDAISRQAVKQVITESIADLEYESENREMQDIIDKLPSATPKEKTAHWINKTLIYKSEAEDERDCYAGTCSACGCVQECWNYCSGCGARMVSE